MTVHQQNLRKKLKRTLFGATFFCFLTILLTIPLLSVAEASNSTNEHIVNMAKRVKVGSTLASWDPKKIAISMKPGSTYETTASITLRNTEGLNNLELVVTPSLANIVAVRSDNLRALRPESPINLDISISLGDAVQSGILEGTIKLRSGARTVAIPLPVTISVQSKEQTPQLTQQEILVDLGFLLETGINTEGFSIHTFFSQRILLEGERNVFFSVVSEANGQVIFISDEQGGAFLPLYITPAAQSRGVFEVSAHSIADGLIMVSPLMLGISRDDRAFLLESARSSVLYETLQMEIVEALQEEPENFANPAVFPDLYKYASDIIVAVFEGGLEPSGSLTKQSHSEAMIAPSSLFVRPTPWIEDAPGSFVNARNPTMLFYGIAIPGRPPTLIWGADDFGWNINLGWPPVNMQRVVVERPLDIGDGYFDISFSMLSPISAHGTLSAYANFWSMACRLLDSVALCPINNEYIAKRVEEEGGDSLIAEAMQNILDKASSVVGAIDMIFQLLTTDAGKLAIQRMGFDAAGLLEIENRVVYLQNYGKWIQKAGKVVKVVKGAGSLIPLAGDLIISAPEVTYCVSQKDGIMSLNCEQVPPTAKVEVVSKAPILVGQEVVFDSSGSADYYGDSNSLLIRWDFDGDGVFDTEWGGGKEASFVYERVGTYDIVIEVKDLRGLTARGYAYVFVDSETAGGSAGRVMAFGNVAPWDTDAFDLVMSALGIRSGKENGEFWVYTSAELATVVPIPGEDVVVIWNDQDQRFYDDLGKNMWRIARFVQNGGTLIFGASDKGWNQGSLISGGVTALPGGVVPRHGYFSYNYNVRPESFIMSGLPFELTGNFASHESFLDVPDGAIVYVEDTDGRPTLVEYGLGSGFVMLTGQPLEYYAWGHGGNNPLSVIFERVFRYTLGMRSEVLGNQIGGFGVSKIGFNPESIRSTAKRQ